ncbi:hypothetical protein [Nocardia sp. NPDC051981]|uniref:hypothetical protein n=1 Tax=Nocardia sp. NPDC051981 TaxID=3155417 RepID=UPI0034166997
MAKAATAGPSQGSTGWQAARVAMPGLPGAACHSRTCDTSCPDCLRSYGNARRHALLDWRLALDLLELTTGQPLTTSRSLPSEDKWIESAAKALHSSPTIIHGVPAIVTSDNCVLLTHPLWRQEPAHFDPVQLAAVEEAEAQHRRVRLHDIRAFRRNPISIWDYLSRS